MVLLCHPQVLGLPLDVVADFTFDQVRAWLDLVGEVNEELFGGKSTRDPRNKLEQMGKKHKFRVPGGG